MNHQDLNAATAFRPPPRQRPPAVAAEELSIAAPPAAPVRHATAARLLPAAGAVLSLAVTAALWRSGVGLRSPMMLLLPATMLLSGGATAVLGRHGRELDVARDHYLHYLSGLTEQVRGNATAQHRALTWRHPQPDRLWTLAGGDRMWERRIADDDFLRVRIGCAAQRSALRLIAPAADPTRPADPVTAAALHRLLAAADPVADLPVTVDLPGRVALSGDLETSRALLRAIVCGLAVLCGPHLLRIVAITDTGGQNHWEWLKWLPHHRLPGSVADASGPGRTLVVLDRRAGIASIDEIVPAGAGVTVCALGAQSATGADLELHLTPATVTIRGGNDGDHPDDTPAPIRPDSLCAAAALTCARRLAGYRIAAAARPRDWLELAGIDDPRTADPTRHWRSRPGAGLLPVPIGLTTAGMPVELDLKESAEGGIGPHGLCIGATGSGKSELLRTLVLGLLVRHRSEELNLVLVDFKGGATFADLTGARHVAAVVTNLAAEAALVHRLREALTGELTRRQELLRAAGNLATLTAYRQARRAGARVPPLARLVIIVDEFAEMLCQHPDFADVFAAIGRLGRSLGIHLLLASQRLEEGRLRGLESHLSYRICLRTLSDGDSRAVLGVAAAHHLPATPGSGYLRTGTEQLLRFQTAFVSAALPAPAARPRPAVRAFTAAPAAPPPPTAGQPTILQAVLDRIGGVGAPAHRIWLPPLARPPALGALLTATDPRPGALRVPIGVVDGPFQQRRTPLWVELGGAAGNVAVVGGPQSGKSTTLCTLIDAVAACHDPGQVQFYCLDLGGGALSAVRTLGHVGAVAGRGDTELVSCIVAQLDHLVARRAALFATHTITSMGHYRRMRAAADPRCADDRFGDVFLVIDDWAGIRREFAGVEEPITDLAGRGLSVGVHVVLSAARWAEIRPALHDQLGTRLELRLGDPAESEAGRAAATQVPADRPGRGLTRDGLHMLIATPEPPARSGDAAAPAIRPLPATVDADRLIAATTGDRPVLGLAERAAKPVAVDFAAHPHLLILGGNECGKTATLRHLCREIMRTRTAGQARLLIADPRRSLLGVVESEHLGGYLVTDAALTAALDELAATLTARLPPAQPTQRQLRDRSWWTGPEYYLVIDDYDLIAPAAPEALLKVLPQARDLGLHLIVARRSAGAARALYEPLLGGLRDYGCAALVLSGDPDDGPLIGGTRPAPRPAGRGVLVTRPGTEQLVQVAWSPP